MQRRAPGLLGHLNDARARRSVNIAEQYYDTPDEIGFFVLNADASAIDGPRALADIGALADAIRARRLYEARL